MRRRETQLEPLERLNTPLLRKQGQLVEVSWYEALETAAHGLTQVLSTSGPESIGLFSCSKSTNEMNYAAQKFMRTALKSNNIDSCNRT